MDILESSQLLIACYNSPIFFTFILGLQYQCYLQELFTLIRPDQCSNTLRDEQKPFVFNNIFPWEDTFPLCIIRSCIPSTHVHLQHQATNMISCKIYKKSFCETIKFLVKFILHFPKCTNCLNTLAQLAKKSFLFTQKCVYYLTCFLTQIVSYSRKMTKFHFR